MVEHWFWCGLGAAMGATAWLTILYVVKFLFDFVTENKERDN